MDTVKLDNLRHKLKTATQFREIVDYFLDEVSHEPDFMSLGEVVRLPFLESVIQQVGNQCFPPVAQVNHVLLTRISELQFIHGACMINGQPGTMIFFEDLQMGLFTLAIKGKETKFARFSAKPYPQGIVPSPH